MGLAHGNAIRGSAAFFAMLLAATSAPDSPGMDSAQSGQSRPTMPDAIGMRATAMQTVSKFTRRRLRLARRMPDGAQPG
jgi:hypothetical protein